MLAEVDLDQTGIEVVVAGLGGHIVDLEETVDMVFALDQAAERILAG